MASVTIGYPTVFPFDNTSPTNWTMPGSFTQKTYTSPTSGQSGVWEIDLKPYDLTTFDSIFFATGTDATELTRLVNHLSGATNGTVVLLATQGPSPFGALYNARMESSVLPLRLSAVRSLCLESRRMHLHNLLQARRLFRWWELKEPPQIMPSSIVLPLNRRRTTLAVCRDYSDAITNFSMCLIRSLL